MTSTQDRPNHIGNLHSSRIRRKEALCITNPRTMIISTKTPNKRKLLHPVRNTHRLPSSICKRRGSHLMFTLAHRVGRRRTRTFSAHPDLYSIVFIWSPSIHSLSWYPPAQFVSLLPKMLYKSYIMHLINVKCVSCSNRSPRAPDIGTSPLQLVLYKVLFPLAQRELKLVKSLSYQQNQ